MTFPRSALRPAFALLPVLSALILVASTISPALADKLWTWRDAQGRISIGDLPPPRDIPERDILKRPSGAAGRLPDAAASAAAPTASSASTTRTASPANGRSVSESRLESPPAAAASSASVDTRPAAQRAEVCARARRQLVLLESGRRIARVDAQGAREVLDDVTLAAELRNARQAIASECP